MVDSSEEMADSESRQFSPDKEPCFAEELLDWQRRELPRRFLSGQVVWDDDAFIPEGASEKHRVIFRRIYRKYFLQIFASDVRLLSLLFFSNLALYVYTHIRCTHTNL